MTKYMLEIKEDDNLTAIVVMAMGQTVTMLPGDSLDICLRNKQRWFLSMSDGQSFVEIKYKKLGIRLQKAWSILRGDSWWEKVEILPPG